MWNNSGTDISLRWGKSKGVQKIDMMLFVLITIIFSGLKMKWIWPLKSIKTFFPFFSFPWEHTQIMISSVGSLQHELSLNVYKTIKTNQNVNTNRKDRAYSSDKSTDLPERPVSLHISTRCNQACWKDAKFNHSIL